ncbi:hypothetical protein FB595_104220 [Sphingobium sp. AEW010]|nr:hypothetical protein FB595_104220 [Sphingobium sp. AEW010]TWD27687.1 hypothetical protein FB594_105108 [Sphingobium sp. AEW001]
MIVLRRFYGRLSLVSLAVLAACSTPVAPPPPPTPPPPLVETVRPRPPMGAVENMSIPEIQDGKYLTPNRKVTSNTALWHVRMALNVAALSCRSPGDLARLQYNRLLHVHGPILTQANEAVDRNYKVAYGAAGFGARERLNTTVYNFFSLPPVMKSFCPVAEAVGAKLLAMPSSALLDYAPTALAELEKPFQDFYAAYADYLRRLAEWQSRFGGTVTVWAVPSPLPPPPVPPGEAPRQGFAPSVTSAIQQNLPPPPDAAPAAQPARPPAAAPTQPATSGPKLMVQPLPTNTE